MQILKIHKLIFFIFKIQILQNSQVENLFQFQ